MQTVLIRDIANTKEEGHPQRLATTGVPAAKFTLIIRDGTGFIQGVMVQAESDPEIYELAASIPQESSIAVQGTVKRDARSPLGYELVLENIVLISEAKDYPISLKEHGVDFLLDHRHLWLRTPRQGLSCGYATPWSRPCGIGWTAAGFAWWMRPS